MTRAMTECEFEALLHHCAAKNALIGRIALRNKCATDDVRREFDKRLAIWLREAKCAKSE